MKHLYPRKQHIGTALALVAGLGTPALAQNPVKHLTAGSWTYSTGLDYLPGANAYLLANGVQPVTIGGMPNSTSSTAAAPIGRLQLEVIPENFATTTFSKTYCTNAEVNLYRQRECPGLSTYFYPADVRRTQNGGYIVCGQVARNQELGSCPIGPMYNDGFLLRTDASGNPVWYKRYEFPGGGSARFNTVAEDPTTGTFVVGGGGGFIMGTDATGNPQWQQTITTTWQRGPLQGGSVSPGFSRVVSYTQPGSPQHYFVLVGTMGYTEYFNGGHASYGGGVLTTVDPSGAVLNTRQLTQDNQETPRFLQFASVTDAIDGDVVVTGSVGGQFCSQHDANNTMLLKMDPMGPAVTFMRMYENGAGVCNTGSCTVTGASSGAALTMNGAAGSNISVSGYGDVAGGGLHTGAVYLETDNTGNVVRYVTHDSTSGVSASQIVYNSTSGYPAYAGSGTNGKVFVVKHKLSGANTDCDPDAVVVTTDLQPDPVPADATPGTMIALSEPVTAYALPNAITHYCGSVQLREAPAGVAAVADPATLTLAPNPARSYVEVTLPASAVGALRVYDFAGRVVQVVDGTPGTNAVRINTAALAPGLYTVGVQDGAGTQRTTFVKE